MAVNIGNTPLKAAYVGATPLKAIYVGATQVWSSTPTEVLPANTKFLGTRDDFHSLLTRYGLDYRTVKELPFNLDTSQVTNMSHMFNGCSSLTTAPEMDTSNVTDMLSLFYNCSSLVSVPDLDTSNVTHMNSTFYNCRSLTDGNVRLIGRHPQVDTLYMLDGSRLTREPFYDASGNPI